MECPDCRNEMGERVDTTFSNIKTDRASKGEHTGDIYYCKVCDIKWIDDFLNRVVRPWQ